MNGSSLPGFVPVWFLNHCIEVWNLDVPHKLYRPSHEPRQQQHTVKNDTCCLSLIKMIRNRITDAVAERFFRLDSQGWANKCQ